MEMLTDMNFAMQQANIKVIGVGGGGNNAVQTMIESGVGGVTFICANTDAQALSRSSAEIKIQLGEKLTKGLGAGAQPDVGRAAAQESLNAIKEAIGTAEMVFVTAGMGGGTGTGAAPVIAQVARDLNILTVGVVTRPFLVEGPKRAHMADAGIKDLREHVDSLIVIPNERLFTLGSKKATFKQMLKLADGVLCNAVSGIADLITHPGDINLDFADVRTAMSGTGGMAMMGIGVASGETRAIDAAKRAISSSLLDDVSIVGAKALLINISTNDNLLMEEFGEVNSYITDCAKADGIEANIFLGASVDESLGDELRVSVIATGIEQPEESVAKPQAAPLPPGPDGGTKNNVVNFVQTKPTFNPKMSIKPVDPNDSAQFEKPPFWRDRETTQTTLRHNPGTQDSFIFGDEDSDLPACLRLQAN